MALRKTGPALRKRGALLGSIISSTGSGAATPPPVTPGTDFGIGLIGQSEMANWPSTPLVSPLADSRLTHFLRNSNTRVRFGNYNDNGAPGTPSPYTGVPGTTTTQPSYRGDAPVYLGNAIAAALGVNVCLIERAVGASSINSWVGAGANWATFAAAVQASGVPLKMVIWYQGPTDAADMSATTYREKLAQVHAQCLALPGVDAATFKFGVISTGPGKFSGSLEGDFGKLRLAQVDYATNTPGAFLACNAYDASTGANDSVHPTGESYNRHGRRVAKSALAALGIANTGRGGSGAGPRITGATRSGAVITVTVAHAGGNALQDGAGGTGASLSGFRVFDNGATATISATAITSPTTITLTLASAPAGTVTLTHAVTDAPCDPVWGTDANPAGKRAGAIAFTAANCVYDNDGYSVGTGTASTTLGSPLQPWSGTVTGS
ncbi:sialate O-acetylesterase [Azohydromonas aeria]|uniref:sialate O-acetylesterase n=1 Tax=Azohydromonas aeria TaxID=2590212 RepID=UPI0012FA16A5|nr:sialate O-acetylesterase [Azohydromonas aeria]